MYINDLDIYRGKDILISDNIVVRQPTVGEICDYDDGRFYNMIGMLTSVGADLKWQLHEIGIDYTQITDYELFYSLLYNRYDKYETSIIFGDINFKDFKLRKNLETDEIVLYDPYSKIIFDRYSYNVTMEIIRKTYGFKRNDEIPANEATRLILIEDAKNAYEENKNKPYKSQMLNLVSSMVNSEGFKHDEVTVFNMKIGAFMDSVKRISKIKSAELLLQSGYSGYGISFKDIDKKQLDWLGEL